MNFTFIINCITSNYLELTGVLLTLFYLFFSVRGRVWLWVFGLLSATCFAIIFFKNRFYATGSLQFYYITMSIYGLYFWLSKKETYKNRFVKITKITKKQLYRSLLIVILCFVIMLLILKKIPESAIPIGDSFTTALCVAGTWLLARKVLEYWLFFVVADSIYIGLFIYQDMLLTAFLYIVYVIMGIVGFCHWKKQYRIQHISNQTIS